MLEIVTEFSIRVATKETKITRVFQAFPEP